MAKRDRRRSRAVSRPTVVEYATFAPPGPLAASLPVEQYLAAIVAHELSNPYTAMAGRIDLMRSRKDLSAAQARDIAAMRSAGERIENILANLKTFSRREAPPPRPVETLPVVQAALERFRESPAGASVDVRLGEWPGTVRATADPVLLEGVIAATLEVLAERHETVTTMDITLSLNDFDEEMSICFQDDGPPFTEEETARVFHPFGGGKLFTWGGIITLAYGYYVIRAWGGTFRFLTQEEKTITELCLSLQP